jgi:hypothetical protein
MDAERIDQGELLEAQERAQGKMSIKGEVCGRRDWNDVCIGSVEFSTNGPQGGDAGHGGFLRVTFTNSASTCIEISVDHAKPETADSITITFRGDAEIGAAIGSIEFLAAKLKAIRELCRWQVV